jgi:hypothetical protein
MAYGQISGYEPHPEIPGAYNFMTPGGPLTFGGPAADELKRRYDASNQAQIVAGDNAAPGPQIPIAPGPLKPPMAITNSGPPASIAALSPGEAADVASGGMHPIISNGVNTGLVEGPGGIYEHTRGTTGISQAKRQATAKTGTATPTAQSESVTGAHTTNQDYLDARNEESIDQQLATNQQRDAEIKAEQAGQAVAKDQFLATTAQQQTQQALVNDIQAQVGQAQAARDQALKDYTGTKIDPDRIFHGGAGIARSLGMALAAGAGAWGATVGHTQNFAAQSIDNMISRDIAAQEADLRTKKDASDTALGDLVRRGMSLDQAKGTLRTIQNSWAQQQLALAKGSSSVDAINANYDALISRMQQANDTEAEKYRQAAEGTATKNVQSQVLYPVAATGGGLRLLSGEKGLGVASQLADVKGKQIGNVKTEAEATKTEAEINKLKGAGAKPNAGEVDVKAGMHELNQFDQAFKAAGDPHILLEHGPLASKVSEELTSKADVLAPTLTMALTGQKRPNPTLQGKILETLKRGGPKARALIDEAKAHLQTRLEQEQSKGPGGGLQQALSEAISEEQPAPGEQ